MSVVFALTDQFRAPDQRSSSDGDRSIDHCAVYGSRTVAHVGGKHAFGRGYLRRRRNKSFVEDRNLCRMNAESAGQALRACAPTGRSILVEVAEVGADQRSFGSTKPAMPGKLQ